MAWAPLLLALLVHGSGSLVQAALTQPTSLSVEPGKNAQITCSGSSYSYGWYQQKVPGSAIVTVIYGSTGRPSGIPSRFSGSSSGSTATLTITGVQPEDEAVYYCGSYDGSTNATHTELGDVSICAHGQAPLLWGVGLVVEQGSLVQAALTQPASLSVEPGKNAQITCSGLSSSSNVGWFQQKVPGSAIVTVIYGSTGRPSGIPSRFSGSKSGTTATLTITGVQAEDEAVYYCGRRFLYGTVSLCGVFGAGTMLTVLGQPKVAPTVHLFPPSSDQITTESKATLVCLMGDFYPGVVQVTWTADGKTLSNGVETTQALRQTNNKYAASSYLTLTASDWKKYESYSCKVTHDAGNVEKSLNRSECS
ncbi:immunoglobulin lambda-1 light chain-like [Ara ararauna]